MLRFLSKVVLNDAGCWLWVGSRTHGGYGRYWIDGGTVVAHRVAWEMFAGAVPDGLLVCHTCDVPACVNPDHLFLGTHKANTADMWSKGRHSGRPGEKHPLARLTSRNVEQIKGLKAIGLKQKTIAELFFMSQAQVSHIIHGKRWKS